MRPPHRYPLKGGGNFKKSMQINMRAAYLLWRFSGFLLPSRWQRSVLGGAVLWARLIRAEANGTVVGRGGLCWAEVGGVKPTQWGGRLSSPTVHAVFHLRQAGCRPPLVLGRRHCEWKGREMEGKWHATSVKKMWKKGQCVERERDGR